MAINELNLTQRNMNGVDVNVKLIEGRQLQVSNKAKSSTDSFSVDILSLKEKSSAKFLIAWKWLLLSIGMFLVSLLLLKVLPQYLNDNRNLYLGMILLFGTLGVILSFVKFILSSSRQQIFYSHNANVPILSLKINKPSKKEFSAFISQLEKRINKFRQHMNIDEEKQLTGEMKMLRRLSDEGVISKAEYENAKSKLFSGFDSKVVSK